MKSCISIGEKCGGRVSPFGFNGKEKDNEITGNDGSDYDFGARIYDTRLGRWLAKDPAGALFAYISPYQFAENNPIVFIDPNGEFIIDPAFEKEFPHVALILANADKLYNGQPLPPELQQELQGIDLQKVFNANFRAALIYYSTLDNATIQQALIPGQGPKVSTEELDLTHGVNGYTAPQYDKNGNMILNSNESSKDKNGKVLYEGHIKINIEIVEVLEYELGGEGGSGFGGTQRNGADLNDAFIAFISTLFHEFVHYGRNKSGSGNCDVGMDGKGVDYGVKFEVQVFGKNVSRLTKHELTHSDGTHPKKGTGVDEDDSTPDPKQTIDSTGN